MALNPGVLNPEDVKGLVGKAFGINPNSDYDREDFTKHGKSLFKTKRYYNNLVKNPFDVEALDDLINITSPYLPSKFRDQIITEARQNPRIILDKARLNESFGDIAMAKFVEHNRTKMLNTCSSKELYTLFLNSPLAKSLCISSIFS